MRTRFLFVLAAAAFVLAALAGCGGTSAPAIPGLSQPQSEFVAGSGNVDSRLHSDPKATAELGKRICDDIAAGKSDDEVIADAQRFSQGEGTISRQQAADIVDNARKSLCS